MQHWLDTPAKTSHPETLGAVYSWENTKQGQISDRNLQLSLCWRSDLEYMKYTVPENPDLLQALAILSDTTVRRFAINQEHLKP